MNIANWTVLDKTGPVWSVACHCGYKTAFPKSLLELRPPKCKRCGSAAAPVQKAVDKAATPPVATPIDRERFPALIGKRPDSEMEADPKPAKVAKVKAVPPPPPPPPVKVKRVRREAPPVRVGPVDGTHWTVLSESYSIATDNRPTVIARCACGTERKVVWCSIWIGKSKSCGCLRAAALNAARRLKPCKVARPGMVYGAMTVQAEGPRRGRLRSVSCLCGICGTTRTIRVQDLRSYKPGNCSCAVAVRRDKESQQQRRARMALVTAARLEGQRLQRMAKLRDQIAHLQAQLGMLERLQSAATVAQ
jgi:hypothetical protein